MKNKFLIVIILFTNFSFLSAQLEELKNIDSLYDKKTGEIKSQNKRPKKYLPLLSELNKERILEYNKILTKYYENDSLIEGSKSSYADLKKVSETIEKIERAEKGETVEGLTRIRAEIPKTIEKQIEYKNGGIGGFRTQFAKLFNMENLPYYYNMEDVPLSTILTFVIDVNGNIRKVEAKGNNEELNTLAKVALYKTSGNWIPAESDGKKINYVFAFPVKVN